MKKSFLSIFLIVIGFMFYWVRPSPAVTFTVNTTADTVDINPGDGTAADAGGNCSLRAAIMEANALYGPDTIVLPEGTFKITIGGSREDQGETGDLDIFSHLFIRGAGKTLTVIDGSRLDRVFDISGNVNVSISDLTVVNGHAPDGKHGTAGSGGGGDGESGGGIRNIKGTLSLQNCKIVNNSAGDYDIGECEGYGGDGGGIYSQGTLLMDRCTIHRNRAGTGWDYTEGGGICQLGHMDIKDSVISENSGSSWGGGIFISGEASIAHTTIIGNETTCSGSGGGIYVDSFSDKECTVVNCAICGNASEYGGGIAAALDRFSWSNVRIKNTIIADNIGDTDGNCADCCGVLNSRGDNLIENIKGCDTIDNDTPPDNPAVI